jgi:hypothetical protein
VSIAAVGVLLALFAVAVLSPWSTNADRITSALDPEEVVAHDAGTGSLVGSSSSSTKATLRAATKATLRAASAVRAS